MKKWNVLSLLLCSFLCVTITVNAQEGLSEASALLKAGKFKEANLAYEYVAYSSDNPSVITEARLGRAQALKKMHAYTRSLEVLGSINLLSINESLRPRLIYETVLLSFLDHNYQEVLARGQMGEVLIRDSDYADDIYFILALAALEEGEWEKAKHFGNSYIINSDLSDSYSTEELLLQFDSLMRREPPKLKDPDIARKWSTIIPGSGQIYSGAVGDGIYNFTLHAVTLGLSAWVFVNGYYVTGWLTGATLLQKLHSGGQIRAEEICTKRNRLKIQKYSQPVKSFLIKTRE